MKVIGVIVVGFGEIDRFVDDVKLENFVINFSELFFVVISLVISSDSSDFSAISPPVFSSSDSDFSSILVVESWNN